VRGDPDGGEEGRGFLSSMAVRFREIFVDKGVFLGLRGAEKGAKGVYKEKWNE